MREDLDETTLQENADLSADLPPTDDATPGTLAAGPGLDGQDQLVGVRGASTAPTPRPPAEVDGAASPPDNEASKQADRQEQEQASKRPTFLTLIGIFLTVLAFFARREQRTGQRGRIGAYDLALLSLGSYRTARLIAFDQVTEPLRAPVVSTSPGGASDPKGGGIRRAIGELISCPTCIGTWIAAALTYAFRLFPVPTRLFLAIVSVSAFAEILNYAVNAVDAIGKAASKQAEQ